MNNPSLADRHLDRRYPMPRPALTLDDFQRARHLDLPTLSDLDLACEAHRVMSRLAYEPDRLRRDWLIARREAVQTERRRRQRARR